MHRLQHSMILLCLAAAVAALALAGPIPAPQEPGGQVRVYDKDHKGYHNWDDNENRAWGQYLNENHKSSHEFATATRENRHDTGNGATPIPTNTRKVAS